MKRTMAAILYSMVLVVGFIGCSGTEKPKTSASGDGMMMGEDMKGDPK